MITTPYLVTELLEKYDLSKYESEFAEAYINFETRRAANKELTDLEQDSKLLGFTEAARSDSIQAMFFRHDVLREEIVKSIPDLVLKDAQRDFSEEQRTAIYLRDRGVCRICQAPCEANEFHADHVEPHSRGGETKVSNGQALCPKCNQSKGNR